MWFFKKRTNPNGLCPNPHVRHLVELFAKRGLDRVDGVSSELNKWTGGDTLGTAHQRPARPAGMMERWSPTELGLTKLYLETLPPAEFTFADWEMVIDHLVQRYLPSDDARTEAEWLVTRSNLMGRMHGTPEERAAASEAARLLCKGTAQPITPVLESGLTPVQVAVLAYGNAHCAENIDDLTDTQRHRIKRCIMDYTEAKMLGNMSDSYGSLETRLFDKFGALNRDWREIADSEVGEIENQGLIASLAPGARVKRVERYRGACAFCRSIDGRIMTVIAADAPDKDGETQVWPGKTNFGRSSPLHECDDDEELADCEPQQSFWIAAGVQHPNCRGWWQPLEARVDRPGVNPEFSKWMDETLGVER